MPVAHTAAQATGIRRKGEGARAGKPPAPAVAEGGSTDCYPG